MGMENHQTSRRGDKGLDGADSTAVPKAEHGTERLSENVSGLSC